VLIMSSREERPEMFLSELGELGDITDAIANAPVSVLDRTVKVKSYLSSCLQIDQHDSCHITLLPFLTLSLLDTDFPFH
jgi:hypothetical protein